MLRPTCLMLATSSMFTFGAELVAIVGSHSVIRRARGAEDQVMDIAFLSAPAALQ
jgi:hypothetical protein